MRLFNNIFYILLFIGFFLPTNSNFYLPLPGVLLKYNELAFLLLPIINLFCSSKSSHVIIKDRKIQRLIIVFLYVVLLIEISKVIIFNQSIGDMFKSLRFGLPLFSSLFMVLVGIKADIHVVWKVLLLAISVSVILTLIGLILPLPIYYSNNSTDILAASKGRIMNSNSSFGIIGLYLLFKDKEVWYNKGKLIKYTSILSILSLLLAFNRTYLALLIIGFGYLTVTNFNIKFILKITSILIIFMITLVTAYNKSEIIRTQINHRILAIVLNDVSIKESTFSNNRDVIYEGISDRIKEGYWVLGLPYKKPIFIRPKSYYGKSERGMSITDTSFVNIILRYGIIPLILILVIYKRLFGLTKSNLFKFSFIIFLIASLNIDSLFRHNSVFFLIIIFLITNFKIDEKSSIYS